MGNVSAKKKSRDDVTENPSILSLNEFADCTAEEYEAATNEGGESSDDSVDIEEEAPITTGNILGDAFKAVESQSAASMALDEAADALTKGEELATQLGLDGVEELENAIDALQGIGPDGTELDDENLAREARVRSAYLDWCKEYGKTSDETRFPQFYKNFLEMEDFAKDTGKEMVINKYADCTEDEYNTMINEGGEEEKEDVKVE